MQKTSRLYFKKLDMSYLDQLHQLHSDPKVMKYIREPDESVERTIQTIKLQCENQEKHPGLGLFCAHKKENDEFIGWGYIYHLEFDPELPIEIGYRLATHCWGQGYGTEIAKELTRHGFYGQQATKLCAVADKMNPASVKILEKCGFSFIEEAKYYNHPCLYFEQLAP